MLGERFVLLQLCKTRYLRHRKYMRNNPVITLFFTADTRSPSRETISWRPSSEAAIRIFVYCISIFIRRARCKLMRGSTKEMALHGR